METLVLTGLFGGAGGALVLPPLWELIVGFAGMGPRWLGEYTVVFIIGGLVAAPLWGAVGAVAGCCAGLIWRRQEHLRQRKTIAGMLLVVAATVGTVTGSAVGILFGSALAGVMLGLGTAVIAAAVTLLQIRRLERAEARAAVLTEPVL